MQHSAIVAYDDRSSIKAIGAGKAFVGIEAAGITSARRQLCALVGLLKRSLRIACTYHRIGDHAGAQHRNRPFNHAHIHGLQLLMQQLAVSAVEVAEHRDTLITLAPGDSAGSG